MRATIIEDIICNISDTAMCHYCNLLTPHEDAYAVTDNGALTRLDYFNKERTKHKEYTVKCMRCYENSYPRYDNDFKWSRHLDKFRATIYEK